MKYKIELRYFHGWSDADWTDETEYEIKPTRFETKAKARTALERFFSDVRLAVVAGNMDSECDRCSYRIVRASD